MTFKRFIAVALALLLLLGALPELSAALAAPECPDSPDGYHHWETDEDWNWLDPCLCNVYTYEECLYCGATRNWSFQEQKAWHVWSEWKTVQEETCTSAGTRSRTCEDCGRTETDTIPPKAHSYSPWTITAEATDHSQGIKKRTCSACGDVAQMAFDPEGTLRRDDTGDAVKELQLQLIDHGYLSENSANGTFGWSTENAVKAFQTDAGLTVDGVAWPQTIKLLNPDKAAEQMPPTDIADEEQAGVASTEDSEQPKPEDTQAEPGAPVQGTGCAHVMTVLEDGNIEYTDVLCTQHMILASAAEAMPANARVILWTSALESEYDTLMKQAVTEEDQAVIRGEHDAFKEWLAAYETYLRTKRPDDPEAVDQALAERLFGHVVALCCLRNSAFDPNVEALAALIVRTSSPERCAAEVSAVQQGRSSRVSLCELHGAIAAAAASIPVDSTVRLWKATLERLYNEVLASSDPRQGEALTAEYEAFQNWLGAYRALIAFAQPEQEGTIGAILAETLMEYTVEHCASTAP